MRIFLTIHARIVIINWFDNTTEVELHVLLNQSRVKWTQVATLVIYTARQKQWMLKLTPR